MISKNAKSVSIDFKLKIFVHFFTAFTSLDSRVETLFFLIIKMIRIK